MNPEARRLAAVFEARESGEQATVDDALAGLVEAADSVRLLRDIPAAPHRLQPGRAAFIEAGVARSSRRKAGWLPGGRRLSWRLALGSAVMAAMLMVLTVDLGGGSVIANSLPGDPLYGVKRMGEEIRMLLARGESRPAREEAVAAERRDEARALLALGREESVTIRGVVERGTDGVLHVGGVPIDAAAWLSDNDERSLWLVAGATVVVHGVTSERGQVLVREIEFVEAAPADATQSNAQANDEPAPVRRATSAPEAQSTPAASPSVTVLPTLVNTRTPQPSPTVPTATGQPTPTVAWIAPAKEEREVPVVWTGELESMDGDRWRVEGRTFRRHDGKIDEARGAAVVGAWVRVEAKRRDGELWLVRLEVLEAAAPREEVSWRGVIESITSERWVVEGQAVEITPDTIIDGDPVVGRVASVRAETASGGRLVALEIQVEPEDEIVEFTGTLETFSSRWWVVDSNTVLVDRATEIVGEPAVGATVEVRARREADGRLFGLRLEVVALPPPPIASPTETPRAVSTTTPTASATPPASPTPPLNATPGPTPGGAAIGVVGPQVPPPALAPVSPRPTP